MQSPLKTVLNPVPAPVEKALILFCEKCGKKLSGSEDPEKNPSRALQKAIKEKCKEVYGKKSVRPLVSSCLDICPLNQISIGIIKIAPSGSTPENTNHYPHQFFTTSAPQNAEDLEKIWQEIQTHV